MAYINPYQIEGESGLSDLPLRYKFWHYLDPTCLTETGSPVTIEQYLATHESQLHLDPLDQKAKLLQHRFGSFSRCRFRCHYGDCGEVDDLGCCSGCKVISYCSSKHQSDDWNHHKRFCQRVQTAMFVSSREEEKIHSHKGDADIPLNAFETARGRFWTFKGLRKYVKARRELIYGLSRINTGEAIETALYLSARLMWLDPKDAMCIRSIVPVLLLRSRRDQQAYNFCKWWLTTGNDTHHEWEYGEPPYLKTNDSDAFEHVGYFEHVWRGTDDDERRTIMPSPADLSHLVAIMLVKVRIFLDLRFLHYDDSPETFTEKYRSSIVLDLYKKSLPYGNPLRSDMNLYDGLAYHVRELYRVVDRVNKHFWPALLASGHGKNLEIRQGPSTMGSRGEAIVTLEDYYDAWAETPNAINFVRTITEEKQRSPHWK